MGLLGIVVVMIGCGNVPPSPSAETAVSAEPASVPACVDVSLLDPDGQPVFLTGRWIGSGDPNALPAPSVFLLRQTNSCLVWVGLSAQEGEALGASWIETFSGQVGSDFRLAGAWEEVPDGSRGSLTAAIEFVPVEDRYEVEIALVGASGDIHRIERWVRELDN